MVALFLGAGFSKWAANLPLAAELFDLAVAPFGVRENRRIERISQYKQEWDAANPSGLAEQFVGAVMAGNDECRKQEVLWYIARRLSEPFIWEEWHAGRRRRHVLQLDETRKWGRAGVRPAADFIAQFGSRLAGIVTLNYDLLVEYALGSKGVNYGTPGQVLTGRGPYPVSQCRNPVRLTGPIQVAKLHGSISWDLDARYTDGRRGLCGDALIVAPTADKAAPAALEDQWRLSGTILGTARRLLVFGFAFNDYDAAVLAHLREAGRGIQQVAVVDVVSRVDAATRRWPWAEISQFAPPPAGMADILSWAA